MTDGAGGLRAVAFGTPDGALWAAAIDAGRPALVCGAAAPQGGVGAGFSEGVSWTDGEAGAWRLDGDGVALQVTPLDPPPVADLDADSPSGEPGPPAVGPAPGQTLCRVQGTLTVGSGELPVDCVGTRITQGPRTGARKSEPASARLLCAWFDDAEAIALVAVRPRGAHQDRDAVAATLFDAGGWIAVDDPRLSTTYDGSGRPTRANLELWIGEGENEYPRRAAGEAVGAGGSVAADGLALQVEPLRCHSRGREGAGVYVLATFSVATRAPV